MVNQSTRQIEVRSNGWQLVGSISPTGIPSRVVTSATTSSSSPATATSGGTALPPASPRARDGVERRAGRARTRRGGDRRHRLRPGRHLQSGARLGAGSCRQGRPPASTGGGALTLQRGRCHAARPRCRPRRRALRRLHPGRRRVPRQHSTDRHRPGHRPLGLDALGRQDGPRRAGRYQLHPSVDYTQSQGGRASSSVDWTSVASDRQAVAAAIANMQAVGATDIAAGIQVASRELASPPTVPTPRASSSS